MSKEERELKKCPFCGGKPKLWQWQGFDYGSYDTWVECTSCGSRTKKATHHMMDKEPDFDVVAIWNGREKR